MDAMKKLYIEPSSRCNYNCKMCFRKTWIGEEYRDMDWDVFENAMNTMPDSVETVFFGGMGEPLIHARILDMVKTAHDLGKRTEIITNGTLLTEKTIHGLIDAGIDMIWVSIDSFREEYYDKIQQNGKFSTILKNLRTLNSIRIKEYIDPEMDSRYTVVERPDLGITFVAMKSNISELKDITGFANSYHAKKVNISNVLPSDKETMDDALYAKLVNKERHTEALYDFKTEISLPLMDLDDKETALAYASVMSSDCSLSLSGTPIIRKKRYCKFVEEGNCFVRYDGNVTACMGLLHSCKTFIWDQERIIKHKSFGNMKEGNLKEIWEGEEYSSFRQRVLDFSFSPCVVCGGCHFRETNYEDCLGNIEPTCGACLWAEGIIVCP